MNTLIPGAPLRSLSPTSNEYQRAEGVSRAAKPARVARFTLDAPEHSGTIPGARGDILTPGVALTSNLAVIFTLNQHTLADEMGAGRNGPCGSGGAVAWRPVRHGSQSAPGCGRMPAMGPAVPSIYSSASSWVSEVSPAARNTLDFARIPRASKLLICGLFQKGRVLAQDAV